MRLLKLISTAFLLACCMASYAWPARPVRIIVPSSAGASPDNMIRLIAARLVLELKQQVIVENKVGAGGIAARQAFELAKDDHTFLLTLSSSTSVAPLVFKAAANFNFPRDTQPVMAIGETPFMIVANPKSGARNLDAMLKMARAQPGAVAFATPPISSIAQLSSTVLSQATNTKFNIVPFSRSADSLAAVYSGDAEFLVDAVSTLLPFVRSHRVQPIAVLSLTKLPGLEEFPLAIETVPGLEVTATFGLVATKEADPAVVRAMFQATSRALQDAELVQKLRDMAIFLRPGGPDAYRAALRKEEEFWGKVIRSANITPE